MHAVSARDCGGCGLGQAEIPHLALANQLRHRADRLLDRDRGVDAMLIIEVNVIDAEPLQRGITGAAHVLRTAVDADPCAVRPPLIAELGRERYVVAATANGPADETL